MSNTTPLNRSEHLLYGILTHVKQGLDQKAEPGMTFASELERTRYFMRRGRQSLQQIADAVNDFVLDSAEESGWHSWTGDLP